MCKQKEAWGYEPLEIESPKKRQTVGDLLKNIHSPEIENLKNKIRLLEEHFLYLLSFLVKEYGNGVGPSKIFDSYLEKKSKLKEET